MDELESRLEHELSSLGRVPLAEPVPVDDLRRRARRVRISRALTSAVAVVTAAVLVGGVAIATRNGSSATSPHALQVAAPSFVLGDIDAVVLSSQFDEAGARDPLPPSLAATVAKVPGVKSVSGIVDTFAPIVDENTPGGVPAGTYATPPRTTILFSYHQPNEVRLLSGDMPKAAGEIIVDADFVSRNHLAIGDKVTLGVRDQQLTFKIVGTFDLPGVNLNGIPLASMPASLQSPDLELDRLDVNLAPGVDAASVRNAIAVAVGSYYTIAQPSVISFPDQRLAQVEIQHAYWALLSPDPAERSTSGVGPSNAQEHSNYEKYAQLAKEVELRVESVTFLSADDASLTYRIFYGGSPSPIINAPQSGTATRVKGEWQLGTSTLCSLAALVGITCKGVSNVTITPPNGYQPPASLDPEIAHAFDALADPTATVDQRVAAILGGEQHRTEIAAGVAADAAYAGKTTFTIAGWRTQGAGVELLYSVQTTNGPSTPWPSTATAEKGPDGHWYAPSQYACGIAALASEGACGPTLSFDGSAPAGVLGVAPPSGTSVTTSAMTPLTREATARTTPPAPTTSP